MVSASKVAAVALVAMSPAAEAFAPSAVPGLALRGSNTGMGGLALRNSAGACVRGGRGPMMSLLEPGKEGFDSVMKRLKKLEKAADGYADTDQADLAEGLKDDISDTRSRVDKARESSKSRIMKKLAMGVAAAAAIGAAVFAFGPRRAYAAGLATGAEREQPTLVAGPPVVDAVVDSTFIASDNFKGAKQGFTFTTGEKGTGYYEDKGPFVERPVEKQASKSLLDELSERKAAVALAAGVGLAVPFGVKAFKKGKSGPSTPFPFTPPGASTPFSAPPAQKTASASPSSSPFTAPAPSSDSAGKDPATMRASELKKAIAEMGGSTVGLVEKGELVELYTRLRSAPRQTETTKYDPSAPASGAEAGGVGDVPNPEDMDPAMVDEMMQNPMMRSIQNQMMSDPEAMRELQDAMSGGKGMNELMKSAKFQQMAQNMMADPEISKMMKDPSKMKDMMDQMKGMGIKPPGF